MQDSVCGSSTRKGCGKRIIWAKDQETGKNIPLDPRAPVYEFVKVEFGKTPIVKRAADLGKAKAMVSHFSTCSEADEFSASRKEAQNGR